MINLELNEKQADFLYQLLLNLEASVSYGEIDEDDPFYLVAVKYKNNILEISKSVRVEILKKEKGK